ncbi:OmpA family protein [Leptospira saintgironsiae]|uniref:OmpA family protein n=1 Tax=Leptospira saintgironsiae TaxID=2023183 RepID=UPI001FCCADF2|nr:OmpA family protein [Leptospira saintgironsiae]
MLIYNSRILFLFFLAVSFFFLDCARTRYAIVESKTFQKFCGCVPEDEIPANSKEEALGKLSEGSLDDLGTPNYLEIMYRGLKKAFEYSGTTFEQSEEGLKAPGVELKRIEEDKKLRELLIIIDGDVAFPSGRSTLTPKAKELISKIADALVAYPETNVRIGGHTDTPGSFTSNLKLSKERSQAVKQELKQSHEIAEERFKEVDGYADLRKIVDTFFSEKKNRRTEVYVGTVRIVY